MSSAGSDGGGETPSRKHTVDGEGVAEPRPSIKRPAKKSPEDDLVCPITLELPFDPVFAEDGRVYDRPAIAKHLENHPTDLKSPVTNEPMGRRLLPAVQVRNHIETLVENGIIKGDLATHWAKRKEKRKEHRETLEHNRKAAENGDADATCFMADAHFSGKFGLRENAELAFSLYRKARKAGSTEGRMMEGIFLCMGFGTEKNLAFGIMLLTSAAERGSKDAAYRLGQFLTDKRDASLFDKWEARHFLQKAVESGNDSSSEPLSSGDLEDAQALLQQLMDT